MINLNKDLKKQHKKFPHQMKERNVNVKIKQEVQTIKVKKEKKPKQKKKKKVIVRNLSFEVDEKELKEVFSKFGTILDVKIPLNENGRKRGFGFVEFEETKSLIKAMKSMNYKEIHGRKVAIDFAVDKTTYQQNLQRLREETVLDEAVKEEIKPDPDEIVIKTEETDEDSQSESEPEEEDEEEKKLNDFLENFYSGADELTTVKTESDDSSEESDSEDSDEDESGDDDEMDEKAVAVDSTQTEKSLKPKHESHDVGEGKTVFLRNVSYSTDQESLTEVMEDYGECEYCLLCVDKVMDRPKGTAFVKFKEKSSADKLIEDSNGETGVLVDGRRLNCSLAISRDQATQFIRTPKERSDRRNLYLLKVGVLMAGTPEAENVSQADMTKRNQLENMKRQKVKNLNFFVSDKRLMIHNLPRNVTDIQLREMFKKAAGPEAFVTEARVMKEFKKTDSSGNAVSKGFGFVCFSRHEDALKALTHLNNNATIFTPQKRPIVEFSVESQMALLTKKRRMEKLQKQTKGRNGDKTSYQGDRNRNVKGGSAMPIRKGQYGRKMNYQEEKNTSVEGGPKDWKKKGNKKWEKKGDIEGNKKNNLKMQSSDKTKQRESKKRMSNDKQMEVNKKGKNSMKLEKKPKTKQQKKVRKEKQSSSKSKEEGMCKLINMYKEKLKNKIT